MSIYDLPGLAPATLLDTNRQDDAAPQRCIGCSVNRHYVKGAAVGFVRYYVRTPQECTGRGVTDV